MLRSKREHFAGLFRFVQGAGVHVPGAEGCAQRCYCASSNDGDGSDIVRGPMKTQEIPWARSVISGVEIMRQPKYNKGLAFTEEERDRFYLRGLLPPATLSLQTQIERVMINVRMKSSDLDRYNYLQSLQERNERLFYCVLRLHFEELLPSRHLPTVRLACEKFGLMFKSLPQSLFLTQADEGMVHQVLKNWPERRIKVVMITDGQQVGPAGDLGVHAVGAAISKLSLISALGCLQPSLSIPIMTDFGTDNQELHKSPFYVGLKRPRSPTTHVAKLTHELMDSLERRYGNTVIIFFDDMRYKCSQKLMGQYRGRFPCFSDGYEGIAAAVLAGVYASSKTTGTDITKQRILVVGEGPHRIAVAEMLCSAIADESKSLLAEAREQVWLVDSKGLVTHSSEPCTDDEVDEEVHLYFKDEPCESDLTAIIERVKPTILIGCSRVNSPTIQFPESAVRTMSANCDRPLIMALSSPTPELSATDAHAWSNGKALFANCETGPTHVTADDGTVLSPSKVQSVYIFPGLTLGTLVARSTSIRQEQLLAAVKTVAGMLTDEERAEGRVLPSLTRAAEVAQGVAHTVARYAYDLNVASNLPKPHNLRDAIALSTYNPTYKTLK